MKLQHRNKLQVAIQPYNAVSFPCVSRPPLLVQDLVVPINVMELPLGTPLLLLHISAQHQSQLVLIIWST